VLPLTLIGGDRQKLDPRYHLRLTFRGLPLTLPLEIPHKTLKVSLCVRSSISYDVTREIESTNPLVPNQIQMIVVTYGILLLLSGS
jgi:hypothetical protein